MLRTDLLAADIKLERPCPICVPPWASRTSIEWIRHVRRHDDIESKTDRNFMQQKCVELLNMIDTELLLVPPSTESFRDQRSVKRALDAADIGSGQILPRKRQSERLSIQHINMPSTVEHMTRSRLDSYRPQETIR